MPAYQMHRVLHCYFGDDTMHGHIDVHKPLRYAFKQMQS